MGYFSGLLFTVFSKYYSYCGIWQWFYSNAFQRVVTRKTVWKCNNRIYFLFRQMANILFFFITYLFLEYFVDSEYLWVCLFFVLYFCLQLLQDGAEKNRHLCFAWIIQEYVEDITMGLLLLEINMFFYKILKFALWKV